MDVEHELIATSNPDFMLPNGYAVVHSPDEAIDYLERAGIDTLYLISGGKLNSEFLKRGLVNQIQLTVTPYILGNGCPFLAFGDYEKALNFSYDRVYGGPLRKKTYLARSFFLVS